MRNLHYGRFFVVFILTLALFLIGMYFGNYFTSLKYDALVDVENSMRLDLLGFDVQYSLLLDDPCPIFSDNAVSKQLQELGDKITYLESQEGLSDEELLNLKTRYALLELNHWLLIKRAKYHCEAWDVHHILYFYDDDCDDCKAQGILLTKLKTEDPKVFIYAIDADIRNPAIDFLKQRYLVGPVPYLIIDDFGVPGILDYDLLVSTVDSIDSVKNSTESFPRYNPIQG